MIWSAWLSFKPEISLSLWIKDLLHSDHRYFNGFGFWLFCGLGGSGKTLSIVEYLDRMSRRYPYTMIYTNFKCDVANGYIDDWQNILDLENYSLRRCDLETFQKTAECNRFCYGGHYYEKVHYGIIFGFDEIHLTFASQRWENAPDNVLEYISQQRKLHKQIVASSQVFTRVDKKLREQTNFVVECKTIFGGRWVFNRYFNTPEYLANDEKMDKGTRKRRRAKRYSFVATDRLRDLYDTFQIMYDLKEGKSASMVAADQLSKKL